MQRGGITGAFSAWMTEVRAAVEVRLRAFFDAERRALESRAPGALPLLDVIDDLTMRGGKRFRPALLAAAHRAVRAEDAAGSSIGETLDAGAALELLQTYLLVHDDWMDGDAVRRGGPSAHVLLARVHSDAHLGASAAILAGDLASAWAWRLLLESLPGDGVGATRALAAARALADVSDEVTLGQYLDIGASTDVETVHRLKTASYTTCGPLRMGALLGSASRAQLDALDRFGSSIGIAFQLRDDVLGVFGDPAQTGKPAGNDLRAGKRTSLVLDTERLGTAHDRTALSRALGRRDASDDDVREATSAIARCGARDRSEERIEALHREALVALDDVALSDTGRSLLLDAAALLVRRAS